MKELVTKNYWWLRVTKDIGKYMEGCYLCQKMKIETLVRKLMKNEVLEKLWVYLMVDFITKLLLVAEKNVIFVVCDKLSKMAYFVAITEKTSAKGLVYLFRDNIWKLQQIKHSVY